MENRNVQARKEEHGRFHDRVQSSGHNSKHRGLIHNILAEEECMIRHNQDDIGIPTDSSTRDTKRVEDSNNISRIGI